MCGIAGYILNNNGDYASPLLRDMAGAISHRGPDDEGFYEANIAGGEYSVGLAHRRLSIIDLDTGHQPIGNEDGTLQIVFNGEVYNFQELRDELIARGHHFKTTSDTETIIHAYEEYGEACLEHLRGMFAFAIWDSNRQRLFLARDRFGKKPLFIYQKDGLLLFASEIKAILAYDKLSMSADSSAIWDYLAYRYVPGPRTLFRGIRKLAPGFFAVWEKGLLTESRYYLPPDAIPSESKTVIDHPVETFLEQLEEAVRIRMVSDVPFGAFLSGGIDSSAVVGLMSRHSDLPIKTFSVGFKETEYSELGYAREIAEQFGTEHHELSVSEGHLMAELPGLVRFRDAPVSEPSDIPIYLLSKEARRSVKMVLTGEGSDEFLGGYPKHRFERYCGIYHMLPAWTKGRLLEPLVNMLPYRFRRIKTAVSTMGLTCWEERMPRWFGALAPDERAALTLLKPDELHNPISLPDPQNSLLRQILCFDQTSWLPDNLLERGDRMTMAASLEARMPFIDHKLAAFVSALPDRYRVRGGQTKWILREAMRQLLPEHILRRPKVGFRVPVNEWFQTTMRDYLYDHLTGQDSRTRGYYHQQRLMQILDEHTSGRQNHEKLLWCLLNLEIWHREYRISI